MKTYLIVKPEKAAEVERVFQDTSINICETGRHYLDGTIGSAEFQTEFVSGTISSWVKEVERLTGVANSQPHAAYAPLTHSLLGRWLYLIRVTDRSANLLLQPLEEAIRTKLIPTLTGQSPLNDNVRHLLALPARLGGMGIINPSDIAESQQHASTACCKPLVDLIIQQQGDFGTATQKQKDAMSQLRRGRQQAVKEKASTVLSELPEEQRRCAQLAQEKGSSSWLIALPIQHLGFALHKGAFRDAVSLRYGWDLRMAPQKCRCGQAFEINHVLTCRQGGFHTIRHNELRDTLSALLSEVCQEVSTEPPLQPLTGEWLTRSANKEPNARLDIRARGFWDGMQDAFFDVRVFHPLAPSYRSQKVSALYRQHESKKRLEYGQSSGGGTW